MASEISAGVRLSLKDQFSPGLRGAGQSIKEFGSTALGAVDKVNNAFSGLAGTLATVGVTIGVGAAVKTYIDLDDRIVRIGTDIGATARQTNELKRSLYAVAQDPSIKMGTDGLLAAMETFSGKNFDPDFIQEHLRDVGVVMKATGATGEEAANFFIESFKKGMDRDEIMAAMDKMSVIGDHLHNQFSLSAFTQALPGLEAVNALLGKSAMNTTELFTAMNILGAGTKSPARAIGAYTAIVNELADPSKQEALYRLGVNPRKNEHEFKNLADILKEIAATVGDTENFDNLTTIFSGAGLDAVMAYHRFGHLADGLEDLGDATGELEAKAASNASSLKSNLTNIQTAFMGFADRQLTEPMEKLTEFLNTLAEDPEKVERYFNVIKYGLMGIAGIRIGAGIVSFIANLSRIQGGGKIDLSGAAGGGAGIPVHVTNWGGAAGSSRLPGVGGTPTGGGGAAVGRSLGAPKISGAMMAKAGVAGGLAASVVAIPEMVTELNEINADESLTNKQRGRAKGGAIGGGTGKIAGGVLGGVLGAAAASAATGALAGSVAPGIGTAIGLVAGALVGGVTYWASSRAGRALGEEIGGAVAKEDIPLALQNELQSVPSLPGNAPAAVLEGDATIRIDSHVYDDRVETKLSVQNNTMPARWETGSTWTARAFAL